MMRNETAQRRRDNETLLARGGEHDGAWREGDPKRPVSHTELVCRVIGLETDLAVATHLLHQWNEQHRADPEDWAAAARLRGTVQETAKFLGAELDVAAADCPHPKGCDAYGKCPDCGGLNLATDEYVATYLAQHGLEAA